MSTCPTCQSDYGDAVQVCPADGTLLAAQDPMLGRVLGERYRVLTRIGEGGMGTVYRVEHVVLGRRMAVKVLRPEYSADEDLVRRFQREAVAASRIGQENIVDVVDFGRTREGNLYFVMEELDGVSLASVLHAQGPLPFDRAAGILAQVVRALAAAHGHGIVHRDLKPDNVLLLRREDGTDFVKVVDFGISKTAADGEDRLTRAGTIIGTPEYMAPEQGAAAQVDHRADVYAFGILAYELLTGGLPFQGPTAIATLIEHQTRAPEPPSRRREGLPAGFEEIILRCLEKRPHRRYQSMVEVADRLSTLLALFDMPPVYDKSRTPPPQPAPPGFTARFSTPVRASRGGTVSLEPLPPPSGQMALAEPPEASERRAQAGRRLAVGVAGVALVAALVAWASQAWVRGRMEAKGAPIATATLPVVSPASATPAETAAATTDPNAAASPTTNPTSTPAPPAAPPAPVVASFPPARPAPRQAERRVATPSRPGPAPEQEASKEVEPQGRTDENPYGKIEDLKSDPF